MLQGAFSRLRRDGWLSGYQGTSDPLGQSSLLFPSTNTLGVLLRGSVLSGGPLALLYRAF